MTLLEEFLQITQRPAATLTVSEFLELKKAEKKPGKVNATPQSFAKTDQIEPDSEMPLEIVSNSVPVVKTTASSPKEPAPKKNALEILKSVSG